MLKLGLTLNSHDPEFSFLNIPPLDQFPVGMLGIFALADSIKIAHVILGGGLAAARAFHGIPLEVGRIGITGQENLITRKFLESSIKGAYRG